MDGFAVSCAARAAELKLDVAKGARGRKRKALSDLFYALADLGLSRRIVDVPPSERDPSSWFKHLPPAPQGLLTPCPSSLVGKGPASDSALMAAQGLWSKGDLYYYRSIARLQKLQTAIKAPHRQVTLLRINPHRI